MDVAGDTRLIEARIPGTGTRRPDSNPGTTDIANRSRLVDARIDGTHPGCADSGGATHDARLIDAAIARLHGATHHQQDQHRGQ
jgi:hypothetical protein